MTQIQDIDLSGEQYTVEQLPAQNKYQVFDGDGEIILHGKEEALTLKERFPFVTADGTEVFTVQAQQFNDEGTYTLTDAQTGESIVILTHQYAPFEQVMGATWQIRDSDSDVLLAEITSHKFVGLTHTGLLGSLIPHTYEITDADGQHVGTISSEISVKDRHEIEINNTETIPREPVVAIAMVIDAIESP